MDAENVVQTTLTPSEIARKCAKVISNNCPQIHFHSPYTVHIVGVLFGVSKFVVNLLVLKLFPTARPDCSAVLCPVPTCDDPVFIPGHCCGVCPGEFSLFLSLSLCTLGLH